MSRIKLKLRPKAARVLEVMFKGVAVKYHGDNYVLDNGVFYVRVQLGRDIDTGEYEDVLVPCCMSLNEFIGLCERMSEEEVVVLCASMGVD